MTARSPIARTGYRRPVHFPTVTARRIAIIHLAATWFMVGMIWTIHVVHYPLFAEVGATTYEGFQAAHVDRIGRLLLVPWLTEGVTLVALVLFAASDRRRDLRRAVAIGAVAMAVVLVISGVWSAPAHGELAGGFDAAVHERLMTANLVRALAWSVRGACAAWIVVVLWRRDATVSQSTR